MIQLGPNSQSSFQGSQMQLDPELEAMLRKTLSTGETVLLKVQAAPGEAFIVTRFRIIILKGAKRDPAGRGYGRFFGLESVSRFLYRGWPKTSFIAVITADTQREAIPAFSAWKCSFGTSFVGRLGSDTAKYLKSLEQWMTSQRRTMFLQGQLHPIQPVGVVPHSGETFFIEVAATYYEEKAVRQYVSGSSSISLPVMRGVRMRVGGTKGHSVTKAVLQEDDRGTVAIGDQRIVFSGQRRSISFPLSSIATVQAFQDGFLYAAANMPAVRFRTADDLPGLILKRLLHIP